MEVDGGIREGERAKFAADIRDPLDLVSMTGGRTHRHGREFSLALSRSHSRRDPRPFSNQGVDTTPRPGCTTEEVEGRTPNPPRAPVIAHERGRRGVAMTMLRHT